MLQILHIYACLMLTKPSHAFHESLNVFLRVVVPLRNYSFTHVNKPQLQPYV